MPRFAKAQSTVEYLILVGSVILILAVFLKPGGAFHRAFHSAINKNINSMSQAVQTIFPVNGPPSK